MSFGVHLLPWGKYFDGEPKLLLKEQLMLFSDLCINFQNRFLFLRMCAKHIGKFKSWEIPQ